MEILETENKRKSLRSYEEFKKDTSEYRVDEIIANIEDNNTEYLGFHEESEKLYKELKEMLGEKGHKTLIHYSDAEEDRKNCELYALAKEVYKDLKEDKDR